MPNNRYILIEENFQKQVLYELEKIRQLIESQNENKKKKSSDKLMDTADAMDYLKVTRKTLYKYRMNGMPYMQVENGKIYYNPEEVDQFIKSKVSKVIE